MLSKIKALVSYFLFKFGLITTNSSGGWTTFARLTIEPEYTDIDIEKKQVTGVVKHNQKVYLTVFVDVSNNKTRVKGNLRGISKLTKPFKKSNYIKIIKPQAEFFIEYGITNPKEYYKNR